MSINLPFYRLHYILHIYISISRLGPFPSTPETHVTVPQNATVQANYRQVSNISSTLVDNKIVDHSDVVGASPVGAAPTTSSFST